MDPRTYGNHHIQIVHDRDCGRVLQPIRDKIREAYAAGDIPNYLRLSFLLSNALHSAQERRAA